MVKYSTCMVMFDNKYATSVHGGVVAWWRGGGCVCACVSEGVRTHSTLIVSDLDSSSLCFKWQMAPTASPGRRGTVSEFIAYPPLVVAPINAGSACMTMPLVSWKKYTLLEQQQKQQQQQ